MRSIFLQEHTYEETLRIAIGAKVILNVNLNIKEGLTNGTIGIVKGYHDEIIEFEYEYLNKKILAFITKQSKDYNLPYVHWTRKQYPISLAYWLTMHKCQGQTIDGVVILWDDIFCSGLFYSILSRCRNANNIHIKNLDIKKHILAEREVINLIQQKDIEFDQNFLTNFEIYPDINEYLETYLKMIRDCRISWPVISEYIVNNNEFEYVTSNDLRDEGFTWIKTLDRFLKMREEYMFEKFNNNNVEGVDWRYGNDVDSLIETSNVVERMFVIRDDSDDDSEQHDLIDDVLGLNNDVVIENVDEISKIHDFESDHCIPWVYWIEELSGFEWLLLVFYKWIFQKFINEYGISIFSEYTGGNEYLDLLINAFETLSSIDDMEEYCSIEHWRRFNDVFNPFMNKIKRDDTLETLIESLFYENSPFMMSVTCYYSWKSNWYGEQFSKMLSINKEAAYMVINSHEFNSRSKSIWEIDERFVYKALYENLDERCSKWHMMLKTCRIDIKNSQQFLFIINKQFVWFNETGNKSFTIYRRIEIPINNFESKKLQDRVHSLDVIIYHLKAVIFVDDEGRYSCILKFKVHAEEEWFKYKGDSQNSYLISETYEPDFVQIYSPGYDNLSPWPYVFLYELDY